jgi:SAM-dependent methyltransferase
MTLWPTPPDPAPALDLAAITREVETFAGRTLPAWEAGYLEYHRRRYQDTLRLLPEGGGRRLLDVGSFPGHLSALAQSRGWAVAGLNNDIEGAGQWADFLERCRGREIEILACEVEREPFPAPTASFDAVLFCELFEHLHVNPFHTLKEIFRVLRPGGLLILTTPNVRRAETLFRYIRGWGSQPPVSRTFHELFPSLLYHRHNREYTANELVYYLGRQGKDLYEFRLDHVYHSDSLDGDHELPGVLGQRPGRLELWLARRLRRLVPTTRSQLIARAWRTEAAIVPWDALSSVDGIGPLEEDEQPVQGFTRRLTFPFRLTESRAAFTVPLLPGEGPALLSLLLAHPVPDSDPAAWTRWTLDGQPAMTLELRPSPRPVRARLYVPPGVAARGQVRVAVETTTSPGRDGGRAAGLRLGGQWLLVERLETAGAVAAAVERARLERQAEDALTGSWWHPAESLYLAARPPATVLEMGPEDETQLGPGWYHREDWGALGAMRWTGAEAVCHVGTDGRASRLHVHAYAGEPRLGPVTGRIVAEHVAPDGTVAPARSAPFALAPDTWDDLTLASPATPGRLRVTLVAERLRRPSLLIEGSRDDRGLGLAVKRVTLGRGGLG